MSLATDLAQNTLILFLSSGGTKKIFTVRDVGLNNLFNEQINPEFQAKTLNLESTFLLQIKFEKVI